MATGKAEWDRETDLNGKYEGDGTVSTGTDAVGRWERDGLGIWAPCKCLGKLTPISTLCVLKEATLRTNQLESTHGWDHHNGDLPSALQQCVSAVPLYAVPQQNETDQANTRYYYY